jgi:hypothetical protein
VPGLGEAQWAPRPTADLSVPTGDGGVAASLVERVVEFKTLDGDVAKVVPRR